MLRPVLEISSDDDEIVTQQISVAELQALGPDVSQVLLLKLW